MLDVHHLGRIAYDDAYAVQLEHHARLLAARGTPGSDAPDGVLLLLEHDPPVVTIPRRPVAASHLLATPEQLQRAGVTTAQTDRGGDITYHGPGQLVAYLILDLERAGAGRGIRLDAYLRLLEQAVIDVLAEIGLAGMRDCGATGVWLPEPDAPGSLTAHAKVCAIGIRVKRWITLHGLAFNVTTNLDHFGLIVPCGLAGRPVTSLRERLGDDCPTLDTCAGMLAERLGALIADPDQAGRCARH